MVSPVTLPPSNTPGDFAGNPVLFDQKKMEWYLWFQTACPQFNTLASDLQAEILAAAETAAAASATAAANAVLTSKVTGPASATANALAKFDGTTGKLVKVSGVVEEASGRLSINASNNLVSVLNGTSGSGIYQTFSDNSTVIGDIGSANQIVTGGSQSDFGVNARGARNLVFGTNNAERARIDSSGQLGVGGAPQAGIRASLWGAGGTSSTFSLACFNSGGVSRLLVRDNGELNFANYSMNLDAGGNLLVGTTSVAGLGVSITPSSTIYQNNSAGGSGFVFSTFRRSSIEIGSITQSGTTAVQYNTTSDHRLKKNVRPSNAARFMDIQFRDFELIDGRHDCGVIAHELQTIYPDLVLGEKDATEIRTVEISPAQYETVTIPAVLDDEGNEVEPERTEQKLIADAVTEEREFPVYQQVNYMGLIGRMGTVVQQQHHKITAMQAQLDAQNEAMQLLAARLAALEAK